MYGEELWQEILPAFLAPTNPTIEDSIRAVGELPGIGSWRHGVKQPAEAIRVVRWGLPLSLIRTEESFDGLRARLAREIVARGGPSESDLSECEAAGLLTLLGATVEYLQQSADARAPDLLAHWSNGGRVEVEVTLAEEKYTQRARKEAVVPLGEALEQLKLPLDLYVHILDSLSEAERQEVVAAALTLAPSKSAERAGRWHIRAESVPARDPGILYVAGQDHAPPTWFSSQPATLFFVRGLGATPDQKTALPRIHVYWGLSTAAYMNPLLNKADRFQGSGSNPFVVAIDVASIPGASRYYQNELVNWFSLWDHVAGVLTFELQTNMVSKIFWTWQFIENPFASMPTSRELAAILKPGVWETGLPLYS